MGGIGTSSNREYSPYTSVWGTVSNPRLHPRIRIQVFLTVAGQELKFERSFEDFLEAFKLLGPPKKSKRVFLILSKHYESGLSHVLAGWLNPPDLFVRRLQPLILSSEDRLHEIVATGTPPPDWKDFDFNEDEFIEVEDGASP